MTRHTFMALSMSLELWLFSVWTKFEYKFKKYFRTTWPAIGITVDNHLMILQFKGLNPAATGARRKFREKTFWIRFVKNSDLTVDISGLIHRYEGCQVRLKNVVFVNLERKKLLLVFWHTDIKQFTVLVYTNLCNEIGWLLCFVQYFGHFLFI